MRVDWKKILSCTYKLQGHHAGRSTGPHRDQVHGSQSLRRNSNSCIHIGFSGEPRLGIDDDPVAQPSGRRHDSAKEVDETIEKEQCNENFQLNSKFLN